MKIYLVDAFNVMHQIPDLKRMLNSSKDMACESLLVKIDSLKRGGRLRNRFYVVYDGFFESSMATDPNLKIIQSKGKTADEIIKRHIDKSPNKRNITVVSSDTEVHNYARLNGCEAIESTQFINTYLSTQSHRDSNGNSSKSPAKSNPTGKSEKPSHISRGEINEMMKLFSEG